MASNKQTIYFNEGIDVDNDSHIVKGYRYALNIVNGQTNTGDNIAIQNIPGNVLVANPLPAGTNKNCGAVEDRQNDSIIFFNSNSNGRHGIYRWYRKKAIYGAIEKIFEISNPTLYDRFNKNPFDFDYEYLITGVNLIDNNLCWTDNKSRPRIMDIVRANETGKHRKFNVYWKTLWDGTYTPGAEILLNGDFGSITGWTLGAGWSYSGSNVSKVNTYPDYTQISQNVGLVAGQMYRVEYTVSAYTSGKISAFVGTSPGTEVSANGTHTEDILYSNGGTFKLLGTDDFVGTIDDVSLKPLTKSQTTRTFETLDINGVLINTFSFSTSASTDTEASQDFYDAARNDANFTVYNSVTNKGHYCEIETSVVGGVVTFDSASEAILPANFYPDTNTNQSQQYSLFDEYYIDRARWMPTIQPQCFAEADTSKPNNIKNKVFQFRVQYVYFDNSTSCYGAISNIPILEEASNRIRVNFNDSVILDDIAKLSLIKNINICYREHNEGVWKLAKSLEPYQFVVSNDYYFYNNESGIPIAELDTNEQFTNVPLKCKSQEYVDNRLFDGGITEGYDKIDLKTEIETEYLPNSEDKLYTIKGILVIWNFKTGLPQPVWSSVANGPDGSIGFGGVYNNQSWVSPATHQPLPLQGFVIYAAGTNYYGISRQRDGNNPGNQYGDGNFYDGSVSGLVQAMYDDMIGSSGGSCYNPFGLGAGATDQNGNVIGWDGTETRVFSFFEIKDIPEGKYILRVAGNTVTKAEVTDGTLAYQKTSTSACRVGGNPYTEVVIEVNDTTADANGNVFIGRTEIVDITGPDSDNVGGGLKGYLCDKDDAGNSGSYTNNLRDNRLALAEIAYTENGGTPTNISRFSNYPMLEGFTFLSGGSRLLYTDHNGFFFYNNYDKANSVDIPDFVSARVGPTTELLATMEVNSTSWNLKSYRIGSTTINTQGKTFFNAAIKNAASGNQLQGISVVINFGAWQLSDINGQVKIPIYINSLTLATQKDLDALFLSGTQMKKLSPTPYANYVDTVDIGASDYNTSDEYDADFSALPGGVLSFDVIGFYSQSAFKRGYDGQLGLVYFDEADRKCAVCTSDSLKLKIKFYTEDSTIFPGIPSVSWAIYNRPPDWAIKYQWVRTKNLSLNRYMQWVVNNAEYIDDNDDGTTYGGPQDIGATQVKIDIQNIGYYTINKHPGSVINFGFEKGDRVRLISNETGVYYTQYFDFEILKVVGNYIYIEKSVDVNINKGVLVEFYSPRNPSQLKIYYEFGECYRIRSAEINGVIQKYHTGPESDQDFGLSPLMTVTPARGTFTGGDAYYRKREMQVGSVVETDVVTAETGSNVVRFIDDQSISDFYISDDESIGRPSTDDIKIGRVYRPSAFRFSDIYRSGSLTNGLCWNRALNEKQFSENFGLMMCLKVVGDDLLKAMFENSYMVAMYINKQMLRAASGANLVAISDDVVPRTHKTERTFGTQHAESIVLDDEGNLFGYDEKQGVFWRSSGNGLIDVSEYNFKKDAIEISSTRKLLAASAAPAVFQLPKKLYTQTFGPALAKVGIAPRTEFFFNDFNEEPYDISIKHYPSNTTIATVVGATVTDSSFIVDMINNSPSGFSATIDDAGYITVVAPSYLPIYINSKLVISINGIVFTFYFDKGEAPTVGTASTSGNTAGFYRGEGSSKNRWVSYYSFVPEFYSRLRNEIVMFKDGHLWLGEANSTYNNFFGVQYVSQVKPIINQNGDKSKVFKQLELSPGDSSSPADCWYSPLIKCPATVRRPNGFESELKLTHFKNVYGQWHAEIRRNKLSPDFASQLEAFINGDFMQGEYCELLLENNSTVKISLFSIEVKYIFVNL